MKAPLLTLTRRLGLHLNFGKQEKRREKERKSKKKERREKKLRNDDGSLCIPLIT